MSLTNAFRYVLPISGLRSLLPPSHAILSRFQSMKFSSKSATKVGNEVELELLHGESEGIAFLSLNRPSRKNALGKLTLSELFERLQTIRKKSYEAQIRCLILRSKVDGMFGAGGDLKEIKEMSEDEAFLFVQDMRRAYADIQALPVPTICSIEGLAIGGGLELAMACDMLVAGAKAQFSLPEVGLGIIAGAGGTQRLPRFVGTSKAKELIFTGRRIDSKEAERIGLVIHAVEEGKAEDKCLEIAHQILKNGPIGVRQSKIAIDAGMQTDLATGFMIEEQCYAVTIPTEDRQEGLLAFKERRKPNYKGK